MGSLSARSSARWFLPLVSGVPDTLCDGLLDRLVVMGLRTRGAGPVVAPGLSSMRSYSWRSRWAVILGVREWKEAVVRERCQARLGMGQHQRRESCKESRGSNVHDEVLVTLPYFLGRYAVAKSASSSVVTGILSITDVGRLDPVEEDVRGERDVGMGAPEAGRGAEGGGRGVGCWGGTTTVPAYALLHGIHRRDDAEGKGQLAMCLHNPSRGLRTNNPGSAYLVMN